MKQIITAVVSLLTTLTLFSQQVPRDMVIMEEGTGTWCVYCPGAAMGADDLIENGCSVAVIAYHSGDSFTNPASTARISYYGIDAFPTVEFDGVLELEGGNSGSSMYTYYLPLYQQRIAIPSSFTVEIFGDNVGTNYDISLVLNKVATSSASNIKAHLVLTESNIPFAWFIMNEVDYVERLMVPDQNGTAVDFTNTSEITLPLQFTLDPSWVTSNCELVAFLQDDNTKEILQGTKVSLSDLEPMVPVATFTSSTTMPCLASAVDFYGNPAGNITSYEWTFEGGNPSTSTLQDPTVTYNTLGAYDVQLIVSDGVVYDTLTSTEYIDVITSPAQPDTPSGPADVCQGETGITYSTNPVPSASFYTWSLTPASAGTITGTGTTATLNIAEGFLGGYDVKVMAQNGCGSSPWSSSFQANSNAVPEQYFLSDGGAYCEGGDGIEVTLNGSDVGVDYELYIDGETTGQIVAGTGEVISFGFQTETGIYSCDGFSATCEAMMIGNTYIHTIQTPGIPGPPAGSTFECNYNTGVEYITQGADDAGYYVWELTPSEAGTIEGSTELAVVDWNPDFTGLVYISVQGVNDCGAGPFSDELEVSVSATPMPVISGLNEVCNDDQGIAYNTAYTEGSYYTWAVTGGTIASGQGSNEVLVDWSDPGAGSIVVTEMTAQGCENASENFDVTIDDCTGLGEFQQARLNMYPNPASQQLTLSGRMEVPGNYQVKVFNHFGQVMYEGHMSISNSQFSLEIPVRELPAGIYSVKISGDTGIVAEGKFIRSR